MHFFTTFSLFGHTPADYADTKAQRAFKTWLAEFGLREHEIYVYRNYRYRKVKEKQLGPRA